VGHVQCPPVLANPDTLDRLIERVEMHHPEWGRHMGEPLLKRAALRLVVNREGGVSYVEVMQPTGDENIDPYLEDLVRRLRFLPAKIDDVAYDVRFRFLVQFAIR
jgi:TonB family protein